MANDFYPGKPGEAFRDGKLYRFSRTEVEVLRAWPEPLAWRKSVGKKGWVCYRPIVKMRPFVIDEKLQKVVKNHGSNSAWTPKNISKLHAAKKRSALVRAQWFLEIPEDVRRQVATVRFRHWQMLSFLARCGAPAAELLESNAALAFMLANNWLFHQPMVQHPLRAARSLLRKKRPLVLSWLGFPATRQVEKILSGLEPDIIDPDNLLTLRECMQDQRTLQTLSHLPYINHDVLWLVCNPQVFLRVSNKLIYELLEAEEGFTDIFRSKICDTLKMAGVVGKLNEGFLLHSLAAVERWHDCLVDKMIDDLEKGKKVLEAMKFPGPPIPGIPGSIEPLENTWELKAQGRRHNNCLASWNKNIGEQGTHYVYRILQPEPATAGLRKTATGWCLQEVRGPGNRPVSDKTMFFVENWLASYPDLISERLESDGLLCQGGEDIPF